MELLLMTLARITAGRDKDTSTRISLLAEKIKSAPGLTNSRFYRSREEEAVYCILTTWEDQESWNKAQERYNPTEMLRQSMGERLHERPEQWYMQYLWGYSRPTFTSSMSALHLTTLRPEQGDYAQKTWIRHLRQQLIEPSLTLSFLARGVRSDQLSSINTAQEDAYQHGPDLLNFFSWSNEQEQAAFYANPAYRRINSYLTGISKARIIQLETF